jgi:hypothetical protein
MPTAAATGNKIGAMTMIATPASKNIPMINKKTLIIRKIASWLVVIPNKKPATIWGSPSKVRINVKIDEEPIIATTAAVNLAAEIKEV